MKNSKIDPTSTLYKRAVKREGNFWKGQSDDPANPTHIPQALLDYKRECETGSAHTDRFTYLKSLGTFEHGLSVGCGSGNVEVELLKRGIVKEFTFIDISEESLRNLQKSLPPKLRKRTRILQQDMNFITLEKNTYDFIFCANVLHHLINLEHILLEMNNALTTDGLLVIDDFIGENRFQFLDKRISIINETAKIASKKTGITYKEMFRPGRKTLINSCPFEAIRSDDLYDLVHKMHGKYVVRESRYGSISSWMNVVISFHTKTADEAKMLNDAVNIFIAEERKARNKSLTQLFLFGVYKKNPKPPIWNVKPWTKKELDYHLPVSIFDEGIVFRMGNALRAVIGEGKVYTTIKNWYLKMRS